MGGPGVPLLICRDHLGDVTAALRKIRESLPDKAASANAALVDVIDRIVDARECLVEADEEFRGMSNYAEALASGRIIPPHSVRAASEPASGNSSASDEEALQAEYLWTQLILAGADKGFRSLDTFVGWFVGGTGAAMGLIFANLDTLFPYVHRVDLASVLIKVAVAFGLVVIAKFFGSIICSAAGSAEQASRILDARAERGASIPSLEAIQKAKAVSTPWLLKVAARLMLGDERPSMIAKRIASALMLAGLLSIAAAGVVGSALFQFAIGVDFHVQPEHRADVSTSRVTPDSPSTK